MGFFKEGYNPLPKDLPIIALKPLDKSLIVFPSLLTHSLNLMKPMKAELVYLLIIFCILMRNDFNLYKK